MENESVEIRIGVLLPSSGQPGDDDLGLDDTGHAPAWGRRKGAPKEQQEAQLGQGWLRAAAEGVGQEISQVVNGVLAGIKQQGNDSPDRSAFVIDDVELRFGVKATLGVGKAVEAFFTASGEATVEVTVSLRRP